MPAPVGVRKLFVLLFAAYLSAQQTLQRVVTALSHRLLLLSTSGGNSIPQNHRGKRPSAPTKLAVVLADSDAAATPIHKLATVLNWCQDTGIRSVLVYHPQGLSKGQAGKLKGLLQPGTACQIGLGGNVPTTASSEVPDNDSPPQHAAASGRGDGPSGSLKVCLISSVDAEWPLVHAARGGASDHGAASQQAGVISHARESKPDCQERGSSCMVTISSLAGASDLEPELTLVFGEALTTAGFPPWLMRFSELYRLGALRDVTPSRLAETLHTYSRVAQRFGS